MTGIANLNIVIQQGDAARDAQQLKPQHQDASHVASSVQTDKQAKERTQVQQSPESGKTRWQKEKREERRKNNLRKKNGRREKDKNNKSDHIVDTIA